MQRYNFFLTCANNTRVFFARLLFPRCRKSRSRGKSRSREKQPEKQPSRVMVHSCGRGHHLRPASLAALASACARVGLWPFLPLTYSLISQQRKPPKFAYFLACVHVRPPRPPCIYIFIYYIYILKGGCVLCPRIMRASVCVFRARLQRRAAALCVRYASDMPLCANVACSVHIHSTSAPRVRSLHVSCAFRAFCGAFALRVCNCATIHKKSPQTG